MACVEMKDLPPVAVLMQDSPVNHSLKFLIRYSPWKIRAEMLKTGKSMKNNLTQRTQVVIGPSADRPAIVLRESSDWTEFRKGVLVDKGSSAISRVLAALQAVPDLLLAGSVAGKKLMQVEVHGNLTQAADGVGYRAFAMGDHGIKEQARLFDVDKLKAMVDLATLWRVGSMVVAQKYLHDINQNLSEIKSTVGAIGKFQRDEQHSKIESSYEYLFQIEKSLAAGERSAAVRHKLEDIEADMDSIQRHLKKLFNDKVSSRVAHDEMFGADKLTKDLHDKAQCMDGIIHDYMLAGMTRLGSLQMVGLFPGEDALKQVRAQSVRQSIANAPDMCEVFEKSLSDEVAGMNSKSEAALTLAFEFATYSTPVHKWIADKLPFGLSAKATRSVQNFRGADGSLTPRLDATKKYFVKLLGERAELAKKRAVDMSSACNSVESLLNDRPIRYLVQWKDGAPVRIMETRRI